MRGHKLRLLLLNYWNAYGFVAPLTSDIGQRRSFRRRRGWSLSLDPNGRTAANGRAVVRGFARMMNEDYRTAAYAELLDAVRTGEVAFTRACGMGLFAFLKQNPEHPKTFNHAMIAVTGRIALAAIAAYDFSEFRRVVDVGGE